MKKFLKATFAVVSGYAFVAWGVELTQWYKSRRHK